MSATGRPDAEPPAASDVAARLRDAGFVRLVTARSGDAVAATGLLAEALTTAGVPYQTSVVAMPETANRATDADLTIAVGRPSNRADLTVGTGSIPASRTAFDVAKQLRTSADSEQVALALAGVCAAGEHPDSELLATAETQGIERVPGVGVPTTDLADGIAHSTLVHASFSGAVATAEETLAALDLSATHDGDLLRDVASIVALTVGSDTEVTPRAAESVEQFLRPLDGGRFGTVEGYADVLETVVQEQPGLAVPVALGAIETETALEAWRAQSRSAHETVRNATTGRYDGLFVARCEGEAPVETVARLVRDYRSPEPLVLVVANGVAVVRATSEAETAVGATIEAAAASVDGEGAGTATRGRAQFDVDPTEFVATFREAV